MQMCELCKLCKLPIPCHRRPDSRLPGIPRYVSYSKLRKEDVLYRTEYMLRNNRLILYSVGTYTLRMSAQVFNELDHEN